MHKTTVMKCCFRWADALYQRADGDADVMGEAEVKVLRKLV